MLWLLYPLLAPHLGSSTAFGLCLLAGFLAMGLLGIILYRFLVAPLEADPFAVFMATLGLSFVLQVLVVQFVGPWDVPCRRSFRHRTHWRGDPAMAEDRHRRAPYDLLDYRPCPVPQARECRTGHPRNRPEPGRCTAARHEPLPDEHAGHGARIRPRWNVGGIDGDGAGRQSIHGRGSHMAGFHRGDRRRHRQHPGRRRRVLFGFLDTILGAFDLSQFVALTDALIMLLVLSFLPNGILGRRD